MTINDTPDQYLYQRQGPWPQPSPSYPAYCADEVLNIPQDELDEFAKTIGARYTQTLKTYTPTAQQYAASVEGWTGVTPSRFDEIMRGTLNSRSRIPILDGEKTLCREAFSGEPGILAELDSGTWYKYDYTAMDMLEPIEGTYCAPVKVFFRIDEQGSHSARIIKVNGLHVYRTDSSFGIASVYALQGAGYNVQFVIHPALHFPMDSVLAITLNAVPIAHPLFKLFRPHSSYTLPLDNAVQESNLSVVNPDPVHVPFDPLTSTARDLKRLFGAGYGGLGPSDGDYDPAAYPRFDYMNPPYYDPVRRPDFDSDYGRYLADYYKAFFVFCQAVAKVIKADPDLVQPVRRWADYCAQHVHGFPAADNMGLADQKDDTLAHAMAIFIWNASVSHAADHWSYANQIWPVEYCMRIRRPPPVSRTEPGVNNAVQQIFTLDDMQRSALCQNMFFQAWTIKPNLVETDYQFDEPVLHAAQKAFHFALMQVNLKWCKPAPPPRNGGPDSLTTCQPLVATDLVPYERTIPQSIQY
jgi:hypothetical protein